MNRKSFNFILALITGLFPISLIAFVLFGSIKEVAYTFYGLGLAFLFGSLFEIYLKRKEKDIE